MSKMARLMDIEELADYLKLRKQTIYNWLNQRKMSGIKLGGVWRFDRREIDKWLRSQVQKAEGDSGGSN
ncbi:MAG: helix-turn-helix domain-containing protein [Candidatus Omnitrophota bacterium]